MDHRTHRLGDADLDLDREIEAALGVDPSPGLIARVRATVAAQPMRSRVPWASAIGSVCVVVVAVAVTTGMRNEGVTRLKPSSTVLKPIPIGVPIPIDPPRPDEPTVSEVARPTEMVGPIEISTPANAPFRDTRPSPEMPEVLVDPNQVQAFQQLVISARERRFEASFEERPPSAPWVMTELSVPPITIAPLDPPTAHN
jgi:hypothetical protein